MNKKLSIFCVAVYKCGRCDMTFDSSAGLVKHMQTLQLRCNENPNHASFECFLCKMKFCVNWAELCHHMSDTHSRDEQCKICREYLTGRELNGHLCGNESSVHCEYCKKSFKSTVKLLKHIERMHGQHKKLYRCDECREFFPMMKLKQLHSIYHSTIEKPFMCYMCSKTFANETQLFNHERTHNKQNGIKNKPNNEESNDLADRG